MPLRAATRRSERGQKGANNNSLATQTLAPFLVAADPLVVVLVVQLLDVVVVVQGEVEELRTHLLHRHLRHRRRDPLLALS